MREHAGFGACFDEVGEAVVRRGVRVEQPVERSVEVVFGAFLQQFVDEVDKLLFPEQVFEFAAGFGEAGGQPTELGGVG